MSNYARLRVLLAISVLVIGGSVWLIAGVQREAVIGMQGQLRASSDLLTAMLDQETGLRGYALTGDKAFLEPYELGQDNFERALREAKAGPGREHVTAGLLRDLESTARQWQANGRTAVDQVDRRGPRAISLDDVQKRKVLMDDFRAQDARASQACRAARTGRAAARALGRLRLRRHLRRDRAVARDARAGASGAARSGAGQPAA